MIETASDYNAAIALLTEEATVDIGDINEKMSSGDFNYIFNSIEAQLISLYEKTRVLEDVQNYCREYAIKEIAEKRQKFESKLKVIENNVDSYQDTSFIACEVPFADSNEVVRDRDGTVIPGSNIINSAVVQSSQEIEETLFKSISKKQKYPHYRDSLDKLVNHQPYRVFYTFDTPIEGGIEEEITITFNGTYKCNFLNIKTSNCTVTDVKYINEADSEESAGDINNIYNELKNAKGLKITVCSTSFQNEIFQVDAGQIKSDFWNTVGEDQFSRTTNMLSLYQMEQLASEAHYNSEQNKFSQDVETWTQTKSEVDKRNIAMAQKFGGDA